MSARDLTQLTNEQLQIEHKNRKTAYETGGFIVWMMIGVTVWSIVKNSFGILVFTLLIFAYWFRNALLDYEAVKKEIAKRKI